MGRQRKFLVIGLGIVLIAIILGSLIFRLKSQPVNDVSRHTMVYSNGWFEYSFKYPRGAKITFESTHPTYGSGVNISKEGASFTCSVELYRKVPYRDRYIDQISPLKSNLSMTGNGLTWQKQRIEKKDFLYGFKSTIWITQTPQFMVKVLAGEQTDEAYCEGIVVTFTTFVDKSVASAVSSLAAKQVAEDYAKANYPDKKYLEGKFIYTNDEWIRDAFSVSDQAMVMVSNASYPKFPEPKYIKLSKSSGNWRVEEASDHRY